MEKEVAELLAMIVEFDERMDSMPKKELEWKKLEHKTSIQFLEWRLERSLGRREADQFEKEIHHHNHCLKLLSLY